jgi:hypothetical protein
VCLDPRYNGLSSDTKNTLHTTQARTLLAGLENSIGATMFAMVLGVPTTIGSIFGNVCALTDPANVRYRFLNHPQIIPYHLLPHHYLKLDVM